VQDLVDKIAAWLTEQLAGAPHNINTVYVEWNYSYLQPNTPREVVFIDMNTFGFDEITKGNFDCSNPDDLLKLGDFNWEGRQCLRLRQADHPPLDWTDVLKCAAATSKVRSTVRGRNLLLLIGYHDEDVYDVS
jgi:hypothetical protein